MLETLTEEAFEAPGPVFVRFFLTIWWVQVLVGLVLGHLYSARGIDKALQKAFGGKQLGSTSYATSIGTKIGVLAASIEPPSTCLFTNYNGIGNARTGYIVPQRCQEVKTWEIARATSAAPFFFPPQYIPGLGMTQDGGVMGCNAIVVGRSEFSLIRPDVKPDMVLNFGTGSLPSHDIPDAKSKGFWETFGLTRLGNAYMTMIHGQKTWEDTVCLSHNASAESGHYRLDITLKKEVRLDDTSAMPFLKSLMLQDQLLPKVTREIAQRLFAALFYFELTSVPIRSGSRHRVEGQVLCKRKAGDTALPHIMRRFGSSTILIDGKATRVSPLADTHGNIRLPLVFAANQAVAIELKESGTGQAFPLSGAPYGLNRLITCGGVAASFGTSTHKRKANTEVEGRPTRRRRVN
ncbi:hypothetical protein ACHAO5_001663 [Verticillium nonalfalfae]